MASEMYELPEMVWEKVGPQKWRSHNKFYYIEGDNPDCPLSYTLYIYGCNKNNCRLDLYTCQTFEDAGLECERHRRSLAAALGFVRVKEKPDVG
jgi:hypothetical protein